MKSLSILRWWVGEVVDESRQIAARENRSTWRLVAGSVVVGIGLVLIDPREAYEDLVRGYARRGT